MSTRQFAGAKLTHSEVRTMVIASVLGLLALFSFVSILLSGDDELPEADPRDQVPTWARFGMR
jgi:hypothetical protein